MIDIWKVLIIDDNADDRALIQRALRREFTWMQSWEAMDPATFALAMDRPGYDLIITDYHLHWATGLDLFPIMRARQPGCPIIMFTATGNEEVAVKAMKAGLDDYVPKSPRHFAQLASAAQALRQREKLKRRAEVSEQRFQDLLSELDVGVYRTDRSDLLLDANPAFLRLLGMASMEKADHWSLRESVLDEEIYARIEQDLRRTGKARVPELQVLTRDGRRIWISLALKFSSQDKSALDGLIEDISERKCLDRALQAKEEELRNARRLESIGRLAGGVAHDFNNLTMTINGHSELLLEKVGEDHPLHPGLLEIKKAGIRVAALTRQLLAFSRRQIFQPEELDLNELILSMEPAIRRMLGNKIEFYSSLGNPLKRIVNDRGHVETVIRNLIANAAEAMPEGGIATIATRDLRLNEDDFFSGFESEYTSAQESVRPGEYVSLVVADTGMGMEEESLARLFEPFYTTKPMRKGMGLAAVYGIVKQCGGHVFVHSKPNRGARIRIDLPAVPSLEPLAEIAPYSLESGFDGKVK